MITSHVPVFGSQRPSYCQFMKKKLKVYNEDVKTRHTAHWDWDYLTWKEIEQRLEDAGIGQDSHTPRNAKPSKKRWSIYWIWIGLCLLIVAALGYLVKFY